MKSANTVAPRSLRFARAVLTAIESALLLLLVLHVGAAEAPEAISPPDTVETSERRPRHFIFGLSPFLQPEDKDPVFRELVRFIVDSAPTGASIRFYDAFHLKSLGNIEIPRLKAFESSKTRATQFRTTIQELRSFLATAPEAPNLKGLSFERALRLPQFLSFVSRSLPLPDTATVITTLGSPLYLDAKEPGFSMAHGYFPSDSHLLASRDESVYGLRGLGKSLQGVVVHTVYFGDPWINDLHQEKVHRFWSLYVREQGGYPGSFSGDLTTLFAALRKAPAAAEPPDAIPPLSRSHSKLEMLRIVRDIGSTDWISREKVEAAQNAPVRTKGPMKIGIRWRGDIDLDLYAKPHPSGDRLYFEHTRSDQGYYDKDHRSSPDNEFEFIEFQQPVDLHNVVAEVNYYDGRSEDGPKGEVRIEFEGRIYTSHFALRASEGNQGREGRSHSSAWCRLDIPAILKLR